VLARRSFQAVLAALVPMVSACGSPQPSVDDPTSIEALLKAPPPSAAGNEGVVVPIEKKPRLNDDQKAQMEVALKRGFRKAEECGKVVADCPSGESELQVVFDGEKGRITDVILTQAPFAGSSAEQCIKHAFIGEIVMPFEGEPLQVPYTIKITGPAAAPAKKKTK